MSADELTRNQTATMMNAMKPTMTQHTGTWCDDDDDDDDERMNFNVA